MTTISDVPDPKARLRRLFVLALTASAVVSCGGGGSSAAPTTASSAPPPSPAPSPAPAPAPSPAPAAAGSYSTNFDATEKPISEGGKWRRANNVWTNVQTANGIAFGTNGLTNTYDDSYALLTGTFGADQTAQAVVFRDPNLTPGATHEVELLLRFSDDSDSAQGYECLFNYAGGVDIVRWNGAFGDFTPLGLTDGGSYSRALVTGDVIKATIVGNVITTYINGTLVARAVDSTFMTGQPGISFFIRPDGSPALLGMTSYSVTTSN